MSKTVSFVAKDELAEWLERRADERMMSISAVCQEIVAKEYRRQNQPEPVKKRPKNQSGPAKEPPENYEKRQETLRDDIVEYRGRDDGVVVLEFEQMEFANRFREHTGALLAESDDKRLKTVKVDVEDGGEEYIMDRAHHAHSDDAIKTVTE